MFTVGVVGGFGMLFDFRPSLFSGVALNDDVQYFFLAFLFFCDVSLIGVTLS